MLNLYKDYRIGGIPRTYAAEKPEHLMLIKDEIRKCVAFIGYEKSPKTYVRKGTAFFVHVSEPTPNNYHTFTYLVTAKHIIARLKEKGIKKVAVSLNKSDKVDWFDTDIEKWYPHEDYRIDVAVLPLELSRHEYDYLSIPMEMIASTDVIKTIQIGVGDEVFMTGLFAPHTGGKKNLPIVRAGNIALMSDPNELVEVEILGHRYDIEASLIEARSIGGLSGSPVFVYMGVDRQFWAVGTQAPQSSFYWLGLIHGHYDVKANPDEIDDNDSVSEQEKVNMGIAIVVPATKIQEVIDLPVFKDERDRVVEQERRKYLPTADSADDDDQPFTKEDFEDALNKVMRRFDAPPDQEGSETSE